MTVAPGLTPETLQAALELLKIRPPATWREIKAAYRKLSRELHPDRNPDPEAAEAMIRLNEAYDLVEAYVIGFRFRLDEQEVLEQHPRLRIERQFADSETWGKHRKEKRRIRRG